MARKYRITEEQYNQALAEGLTLNADPSSTGGDVNKAIQDTQQNAQKQGVDLSKTTISIPGNTGTGAASESRILSVKQIREAKLRRLKEGSKVYTARDFIKMLKK